MLNCSLEGGVFQWLAVNTRGLLMLSSVAEVANAFHNNLSVGQIVSLTITQIM